MVDEYGQQQLRKSVEKFYFAYRAFTEGPDRILQKWRLGRVHHRILYFVGQNPQISSNELLVILSVTKQALNLPLRKLIEDGLIIQEAAEHDRRVKNLRLSSSGQKLEARLTNTQLQHLEKVFKSTGKNSLEPWLEIMEKIAADKP